MFNQEGFLQKGYNFVWPKLSYWRLKLSLRKPAVRQSIIAICKQIESTEFNSDREKINFIRNWINCHSVHLIDKEHDTYAFNVAEVLVRLNQYALNKAEKPHLSCGPRAYVMKAILDALGIESRIIDLFGLTELDEGRLKVSPHTLIEVYENDTRKWVLQDPDFNVAYSNAISGEYLSAKEMLLAEQTEKHFDNAGYVIENPINLENTVNGLFEWGVLYRYSYVGKSSNLLVSGDKQLLSKMLEKHSISLLAHIKQRAFFLTVSFL